MDFSKAMQKQAMNAPFLREFTDASERYKKACSLITKFRLRAEHPRSLDQDIILYHKARKFFKDECRLYAEARSKYISILRSNELSISTVSNADLLVTLDRMNDKEIANSFGKEQALKQYTSAKQAEFVQELANLQAARNIAQELSETTVSSAVNSMSTDKITFADSTFKLDDEDSVANPSDPSDPSFGDML